MVSTDTSTEVLNWIADGKADDWAVSNGYIRKEKILKILNDLLHEAEARRDDEIHNGMWMKVLAYDVQVEMMKLMIKILGDGEDEESPVLPYEL